MRTVDAATALIEHTPHESRIRGKYVQPVRSEITDYTQCRERVVDVGGELVTVEQMAEKCQVADDSSCTLTYRIHCSCRHSMLIACLDFLRAGGSSNGCGAAV